MLAHAMLHHPQAWPRQETALGLLISVRKLCQKTTWVRHCLVALVLTSSMLSGWGLDLLLA